MRENNFKFDEIGEWSQIKLDIIEKYAEAYAIVLKNSNYLKPYYIDAFCGAGISIGKKTGEVLQGSPLRILGVANPFKKYYFIDIDKKKTDYLDQLCKEHYLEKYPAISIKTGDCNEILNDLLPQFSYEQYHRLLCLLDPYGLHLDWEVVLKMGSEKNRKGIADLVLNFPVMDMNRTAIWNNYKDVPPKKIDRMNTFWGDESWQEDAYRPARQPSFLDKDLKDKMPNETIVAAYRKRLKENAGFKHVPEPIPMKNSKGATVYYLFFASHNDTANKIAKYLFNKHKE